ncbi:MAG: ABC transporter substrate-binding protein [Chitinophagaceae bacterium]|nr:ABC transporter substrate-binding protein [Chitinophagaceae bacterium]
MPVYTDQTGRSITISDCPKRIISVVPSQTELLFDLGLNDEVIGITRFCVHPTEWFNSKQRVGGTKTLNMDMIRRLHPDLILANKEENTKEQIELLSLEVPVWVSDIENLPDALQMIKDTGQITCRISESNKLISNIETSFNSLNSSNNNVLLKSVCYLIWNDPFMTVGSDTFIHDMLKRLGYKNVFAHTTRYPIITYNDLQQQNPDLIFLSSEPYPFKEKHIAELQAVCPNAKVILVDGEYFSWYGSRLLAAIPYFTDLISREKNPG